MHVSQLDVQLHVDTPLHEYASTAAIAAAVAAGTVRPDSAEERIGKLIAHELVSDGSTLQVGIGRLASAVLRHLQGHTGLGIYSEMVTDDVIDLVECGAMTNEHKPLHPGRMTVGFAAGSQRLWSWLDDNCGVVFKTIDYINLPARVSTMPRMVAINSCLEIDLTGQVCSDSLGPSIYSGVGGQVDFLAGAARARDGKPVIALEATTKHGQSRIVSELKAGAGVTTTRAHVHWVCTEHGLVNLHGLTLAQRAQRLISIAAPEHRDALTAAARARKLF